MNILSIRPVDMSWGCRLHTTPEIGVHRFDRERCLGSSAGPQTYCAKWFLALSPSLMKMTRAHVREIRPILLCALSLVLHTYRVRVEQDEVRWKRQRFRDVCLTWQK